MEEGSGGGCHGGLVVWRGARPGAARRRSTGVPARWLTVVLVERVSVNCCLLYSRAVWCGVAVVGICGWWVNPAWGSCFGPRSSSPTRRSSQIGIHSAPRPPRLALGHVRPPPKSSANSARKGLPTASYGVRSECIASMQQLFQRSRSESCTARAPDDLLLLSATRWRVRSHQHAFEQPHVLARHRSILQ